MNFVCGTVLSGYLVMQGWTAYSLSHLLHHVHLGDDKHDPELAFQLIWGTYNPQKPWWFAIKYLITPPLWAPPIKLYDLVVNRLFTKPKTLIEFVEQLFSLAYFISICMMLSWLGLGWHLTWFWLVPLAYSFPLVNYYNELFEHYPYVGDSDLDVHMTRFLPHSLRFVLLVPLHAPPPTANKFKVNDFRNRFAFGVLTEQGRWHALLRFALVTQ